MQSKQSRQVLALEMLEEQRKEHLNNNMARCILESKAEESISIKEKLDRDRERAAVSPRKQPPREAAAAELDYCHSDSEDMDSDVSTDSLGYEEVIGKYGVQVTDTEINEINSGVDREEFREKTKKKRKFIRKPRSQAPPVLERFKSTDRHSQECVIQAGEGEGTAPSGVGEGK